jgi:hypothetical protein
MQLHGAAPVFKQTYLFAKNTLDTKSVSRQWCLFFWKWFSLKTAGSERIRCETITIEMGVTIEVGVAIEVENHSSSFHSSM